MKALDINNLKKIYKTRIFRQKIDALINVNIQVDSGSIVGLVGPNGSGKSTIVKIILNLVKQTSGKVYIFGKDSNNKKARQNIGYLPEVDKYPLYLSGMELLKLCCSFNKKKIKNYNKNLNELVDFFDLNKVINISMSKYSKGMRKKLGLIQALLFDPKLLILDEPIEGLDAEGKKMLTDILKIYSKKGISVFINSHYLSEMEKLCDKIIIIKKGITVEEYNYNNNNSKEGFVISYTYDNNNNKAFDISSFNNNKFPVTIVNNDSILIKTNEIIILNNFINYLINQKYLITAVKPVTKSIEDLYFSKGCNIKNLHYYLSPESA